EIIPVKYPDPQRLSQMSGYELERQKVIDNTMALLQNKPCNNVLLYGDAGSGKSSTIKAIVNEYWEMGLRLIEIKKNQLYSLPDVIEELADNPLKFIIFIDDLSFSTNDNDFGALKAILEGGVAGKTDNLAIYATSNRRNLVKENFSDRNGDDIHLQDTIQEIMSLSARFGLKITFSKPDKDLYLSIVENLSMQYNISIDKNELFLSAEAFALRNGGRSPRTAKQFIEYLASK
ncbi:MAG: ATP-binding protein, partial [Ruminococcaceae bacterium]|nr:ATP-binding protein [Oscillospiraceae bacterium]